MRILILTAGLILACAATADAGPIFGRRAARSTSANCANGVCTAAPTGLTTDVVLRQTAATCNAVSGCDSGSGQCTSGPRRGPIRRLARR